MEVTQSLFNRRSIREFDSKPVSRQELEKLFEAVARTPSWANSQPWEVFVAQGETLERIRRSFQLKHADNASLSPEIPLPKKWTDEAKQRQRHLQPDMVRDCGDVTDRFKILNRSLFNAPVVVYICLDRILSEWSLFDIGAYSQSLMLTATQLGLASIPAMMLTVFPEVIRQELHIPDNLKIAIGIAIGYADESSAINRFVSSRRTVDETVRFFD